jgi:hypothetical protein
MMEEERAESRKQRAVNGRGGEGIKETGDRKQETGNCLGGEGLTSRSR